MRESEIRDCLAGVIEKLDAAARPKAIGAVGGSLVAAIAIGFAGCTSPPAMPYGVPLPPPPQDAGTAVDATAAPSAEPSATPTAAPTTSAAVTPPDPEPIDPGPIAEYMAPDPR